MATTTSRISFSAGQSPSVDEYAGGLPAQPNVLIDAAGAVRMRPGISAWSLFPSVIPNASPVIGACAWGPNGSNAYLVYVCADRTIWALIAPGFVVALSDATAVTKLDGSLRPVFAPTRRRIVITGGGAPQKWEGAGLSARLGGTPPNCSHVVALARRLFVNDSGVSGLIYYSEVDGFGAGHEIWTTDTAGQFEADSKPDPCKGLYANSGELVALGDETIQCLSPDPSQVLSTARTIDVGWGAPHAYATFDDGFFGMDARNRAVQSDGRSLSVVSSPTIGDQLEDVATTDDCWGARYAFGNYNLALLTFPTDGRTFCMDKGTGLWTEFRGSAGPWTPTSLYYWAKYRVTLVGLPTGQIATLDKNATTDLGAPVVVQMTSTFEDHNTSRLKLCKHARFRFHRGIDAAGGTAAAVYSYRDGPGPFIGEQRLEIGDATDSDAVKTLDSLGEFRQRQHRIEVDGVAWRFAGMELDVEVLGN